MKHGAGEVRGVRVQTGGGGGEREVGWGGGEPPEKRGNLEAGHADEKGMLMKSWA